MFRVPLAPDPHRRAAPRRRLRRQDLREDRAHRERARARGAAGRCGWPSPRRTPSAPSAAAMPACACKLGFAARRHALGRRVPAPTSTWAPTPTSGRASSRRAPTPPPARTASPHVVLASRRRLHEHDAGRRLPRASACRSSPGRFESLLDDAAPAPRSRSRRAAPAEPPRPRRGIRARRDAHRRQVRGEPDARRRGDRWTQAAAADRGRGRRDDDEGEHRRPRVSEAIVRLHADGSATVLASTVEMGQGARTVLAQIAAEVLAVPLRARRRRHARHGHHALRSDDQLEPLHRR